MLELLGEEINHIQEYDIALEDVLISRRRALKKGEIEITKEYVCPRCRNKELEKFYASNCAKCWESLCGVGGECLFCNKCMDIVGFCLMEMS